MIIRGARSRALVGTAVTIIGAVGGLLLGTGTAAATPTACSTHKVNSTTAYAICYGGTGQVRVVTTCVDNFSGTSSVQYGDYKPIGTKSTHQCYPAQRSSLYRMDYQTKG